MSRFKNEVAHLQAHVKTLRLAGAALFIVALLLGFGWWSAPKSLTIHVPPDYPRNLHGLSAYFTPSCRAFLQQDFEFRRSNGELRQRVRGIYEIPGRGYGDDPAMRVRTVSANNWVVTLDVSADEYLGAEQVKRALVRYALKVVRMDVDPERNPFGLALDCHARAPERIETPPPAAPPGRAASAGSNLQGDTP